MKKQLIILTGFSLVAITCFYISEGRVKENNPLFMANIEALAMDENNPNNTGPAQLIECPGSSSISIGKYCMAEGGSACMDIPCTGGGGLVWVK